MDMASLVPWKSENSSAALAEDELMAVFQKASRRSLSMEHSGSEDDLSSLSSLWESSDSDSCSLSGYSSQSDSDLLSSDYSTSDDDVSKEDEVQLTHK